MSLVRLEFRKVRVVAVPLVFVSSSREGSGKRPWKRTVRAAESSAGIVKLRIMIFEGWKRCKGENKMSRTRT